jgi:hypothetical protein
MVGKIFGEDIDWGSKCGSSPGNSPGSSPGSRPGTDAGKDDLRRHSLSSSKVSSVVSEGVGCGGSCVVTDGVVDVGDRQGNDTSASGGADVAGAVVVGQRLGNKL